MLALAAAVSGRAQGQCQVVSGPTSFAPISGQIPTYQRIAMNRFGLAPEGKRLVSLYNYGYIVYSLANPGAPAQTSFEDLLADGYPKSGDGQSRTGGVSISADGTRTLVPWTDTARYGTIAQVFATNGFGAGGDFAPSGVSVQGAAVAKVGSRYIAVSSNGDGLFAADVTNLATMPGVAVKNGIPSERVAPAGDSLVRPVVVKSAGKTLLVFQRQGLTPGVGILDISSPGASIPGLTSAFTWRDLSLTDLGAPSGVWLERVGAEAHPADGALHLLLEYKSQTAPYGITSFVVKRVDPLTGSVTTVGSFAPPSNASTTQAEVHLVAFDADLAAVAATYGDSPAGMRLQIRAVSDLSKNLAESITFTDPAFASSFAAYRSTGDNLHLYIGHAYGQWAVSLTCVTAPSPATALLAVDRVTTSGATPVASGGSVFIGDQLRIKPSYTPLDSVEPLLDWRLDYDFHDGNAADSQTPAMRLVKSDASRGTTGPSLPPAEYTLVGPCDPAQLPAAGGAPNPATGAGCWTSVTSNGNYGLPSGTADFSSTTPADRQLAIAFEVQNARNAGGSSVAKHQITWKVPQARLLSTALLSGGSLDDGSDGSPDTANPSTNPYRWYFATVPVGQTGADVLTLKASCTGPTCNPGLAQAGSYRYWVSVPYRGGFRTAECPGLLAPDNVTCSGDPAKVVTVTDVVLAMTSPGQVLVGQASVVLSSTSKKGTNVAPCPAGSTGFSYNVCEVIGGTCLEGTYAQVTDAAAFPASGVGTLSIPTPSIGTWGLRIKYSYSTGGSCVAPSEAKWPTDMVWSPLTVLAAAPSIHLRNSSDTADLSRFNGTWETTAGQTIRAYADLDGVRDSAPPSGLAWSYKVATGTTETSFGTAQGSTFTISTPGDYEVILRGYGTQPVTANLLVGSSGTGGSGGSGGSGGGGSAGPPTVSAVTPSTYSPAVGETVTFTCSASVGTYPITSYDWILDTGVTRTTTSRTTTYSYSTAGAKQFACAANDSSGQSSVTRTNSLTVVGSGGSGGTCSFEVQDAQGTRISYDPYAKLWEAQSGQALRFVAADVSTTPTWNFGNGATAQGSPAPYTYTITGSAAQTFAVAMTAGSCTYTSNVSITPAAAPALDYTLADAGTGTAVQKSGTSWVVTSGQRLKFTPQNATGAVWWDFGDGENSTLTSPEKAYTAAVDTNFTASLSNAGVTKSYTVSVKGSTGAPLTGTYSFRYSDGTTVNRSAVVPNKPITFTGVDQATTYTWDFGDGSALAQGSPREYSFTRGGTFTVRLTVARTGVAGTVTTPSPLAFVVTPPPDPLLWVAGGMVYADGSGGERWQSDLSVFNPGSTSAQVSLAFVSGAGWDGATRVAWSPLAVGPGETRAFSNVLAGFFGAAKGSWGVVLVRGDTISSPPVIVGRTYNAASADAAGTFGLSVPAVSVANGVKPQSAAGGNFLAGLRHDEAFRTNLTVANLKDEAAVVEVVFRDASGTILGSPAKVTIEGRGVKQLNAALSSAVAGASDAIGGAGYATPVPQFSAEVKIKSGSGVYPYATVIDQGTGDSIVVTPTARPSAAVRLPGIVRVLGGSGTYWVSDVAILNPTAGARKVRVAYSYVKSGTTRRIEVSDVFAVGPYQVLSAIDFVRNWLGLAADDPDGYASSYVDVSPAPDDPTPTAPFVVTGKTYTPSGKGSIGLQLDAFALEDGINDQGSRKKLVLSGLEASARFRTNVALFLTPGSAGSVQVDVRVLDSFGRESKKIANVGLDVGNPFVQINSADLFSGFSTDDVSRATIVIDNPRGSAYLAAYATVIDQKSGDATFVAGQPAP